MNSCIGSFSELFTSGPFPNLQILSNATLLAKDGSGFQVHRFLLSSKSDYFRVMFLFDENCKEFSPKNIESPILEQILVFLYTEQLSLKLENVPDLLIACDFLLLNKLYLEISSFVIKNIDISNCLALVNVALYLNDMYLFQYCYRYTQINFQDVIDNSSDKLGSLSLHILKRLLSEKCLNISSESVIWKAICIWINNNLHERSKLVPELLNHINLKNINESMAENIITHPNVSKNEHCFVINELRSKLSSLCVLNCHMFLQRYPIFPIEQSRLPSFINVFLSARSLYITFDEKFDACQKVTDIDFLPDISIISNHKLHFFDNIIGRVFSWDLVKNVTSSLPQNFFSSSCIYDLRHSAMLSDGTIYWLECVVNRFRIRRYTPDLEEWSNVAAIDRMIVNKFIACGNKLYVFGRSHRHLAGPHTMFAQTYNPESDTWSSISQPVEQNFNFSIVQYHNKLLHIVSMKTLVEEFVSENNLWVPHSQLPYAFDNVDAKIIGTDLYVFEIFNHLSYKTPAICWNEEKRNWKPVQESFPFYKLNRCLFFPINNEETLTKIIQNRRRYGQKWMQNSFN